MTNSRYYNPEWGRFLNADGILSDSILGKNLYAYCSNNCVNCVDAEGYVAVALPLVEQGVQQASQINWEAVWTQIGYGLTVAWGKLQGIKNSLFPVYSLHVSASKSSPVGCSFERYNNMAGNTATPPPPQKPNKKSNSSTNKISIEELKISDTVKNHIPEKRPYINSLQLVSIGTGQNDRKKDKISVK